MNVNNYSDNQLQQIILFLSKHLSTPEKCIYENTSLFYDLGVDGDDAKELMTSYSNKFEVSLDDFDFNSHFGPEQSISIVKLICAALGNNKRDKLIDLTVRDLANALTNGRLS